jgi:hypothetical protein
MQKRKFARKRAGGVSLPELLDRLELALTGTPARMSVCRGCRILTGGSVRPARKLLRGPVGPRLRDVGAKPPSNLCHCFLASADRLNLLALSFPSEQAREMQICLWFRVRPSPPEMS